uniref:Uncharacterized protein n=1 Tax=Neovison vison TaxID=452646 RepID=A0A8C7AMA8_NEOVI
MGPWAFSIGIMLGFSCLPITSFRISTMSRRPEKATLSLLKSWFNGGMQVCLYRMGLFPLNPDPLMETVAEMFFKYEAIERQISAPKEKPRSPMPGPFTWKARRKKSQEHMS